MPERDRLRGSLLVLTAACLWATLGLFYRTLAEDYGLSRGVIVAYRAGIAALTLLVVLALTRRDLLIVRRRDWPYFLSFGSLGVAAFFLVYIRATTTGPLAVAAVLMYTAPVWIMLWAALRQGEPLTRRKVVALALALSGCALVANLFDRANLNVNGLALLYGVLSGIAYAAYSLWSAAGTQRGYAVWTVVVYALGIGALVLFATQPLQESLKPLRQPGAWPWLLGVALGPSLLAQTCFTYGLTSIRTSTASILATIEPVVAAVLGWLVVEPPEPLSAVQIAGGALVLAAVIVLTRPARATAPQAGEHRPAEHLAQ
ncbi:DMT family transporter [Kallotenue papyrolyticum]|uniref:DMT family transporter n=1 Tax=Kallotenue papyrolyticum TaxID=1325125 RepID=UPI00047865A0|nr:DMT family transporter [Kallotenue papyrolyticum]